MSYSARLVTLTSLATAYVATAWWRRRAAEDGETTSPSASAMGLFLYAFFWAWVLLTASWAIYTVYLYPFFLSPLRHLPQPSGNVFLMGQDLRIMFERAGTPALEWANSIPNDGIIRYLGAFNQERLLVTKPKALAEVLVSKNYDFCKPQWAIKHLSRLLGTGLLVVEGEEHRFQRKLLTPAFSFRHVKDLYPVFWRKARQSAQVLRHDTAAGSGAVEIGAIASRATLDIIGVAGMGRDFGSLHDPQNKLSATYHAMVGPKRKPNLVVSVLYELLPRWLLLALPMKRNSDLAEAGRFIRNTCAELVHDTKAKLAALQVHDGDDKDTVPADVDILTIALKSGGFSDANVVDQLMTFLAAGHETTATAMTWAIYLLSVNPDVQDRLRAEIRAHLPPLGDGGDGDGIGSRSRDVTSADIDTLPYLGAVCNEVLRCYPPVPLTLREAAVDTSILGHAVPRGTTIILSPWAVNRSEKLWGSDAGKFDPERWLRSKTSDGSQQQQQDGSTSSPSNYSFLTFMHGPRSCIGMAFARAEFACLLAAWVGRFSFRLRDAADLDEASIKFRSIITARPLNGLNVHASVLEGW